MGTAPSSAAVSAGRKLSGQLGLGIIICRKEGEGESPIWHVYQADWGGEAHAGVSESPSSWRAC